MNIINSSYVEIPQFVFNKISNMADHGHVFSKIIVEPRPPAHHLPLGQGIHIAFFQSNQHTFKVTGYR